MDSRPLRCLREKAYDLVLADRSCRASTASLLRNVRQKRRSPALPFILLSSRNDSASVREVLPLAPTAYLTKPLNMEGLTQRLQDLLLNEGERVLRDTAAGARHELVRGLSAARTACAMVRHCGSTSRLPLTAALGPMA